MSISGLNDLEVLFGLYTVYILAKERKRGAKVERRILNGRKVKDKEEEPIGEQKLWTKKQRGRL
jgi:hypothetical protein